jgi:hypothetical protein
MTLAAHATTDREPSLQAWLDRIAELRSGELRVETTRGVGRIFLCRGRVAWVVAEQPGEHLSDALTRQTDVSRAVLRDVLEVCRRSGANFAEELVRSGAVPRDVMREVLRAHNARQLAAIARPSPTCRVLFRPAPRDYASDFLFSVAELTDAERPLRESDRVERPTATRRIAPSSTAPKATPDTAPDNAPDAAHDTDTTHEGSPSRDLPERTNPERPTPAAADPAAQATKEILDMANINGSLSEIMKLDGAIAAALVDWESGLTLGTIGGGAGFDIELAASGNTAVVKAKVGVMKALGIEGAIEDILITLGSQYHLIRPLSKNPSLFLYVSIDKAKGNLGLARHKVRQVEEGLSL